MAEFPKSKIDEMLRDASPGKGLRVGEDARVALEGALESLALEITRQALSYVVAEKRKELTAADIRRAIKDSWD